MTLPAYQNGYCLKAIESIGLDFRFWLSSNVHKQLELLEDGRVNCTLLKRTLTKSWAVSYEVKHIEVP